MKEKCNGGGGDGGGDALIYDTQLINSVES
jgi:hypothetical protein